MESQQQQQSQPPPEGSYPRGEKRPAADDATYWDSKDGHGDESSRPAKISNWDAAPPSNSNTPTGDDEDDGKFHKDVPLPYWAAGKVIGKQGDTIKRIQRQTHCEVKSDHGERDSEGNRSLHLVGDTQEVLNACEAAIEEIIFTCRKPVVGPGDSKKEVVISNDIAAKVIGYRGCVIDEIKRRSHTRIEVVPTENGGPGEERTVVLVGPEENCEEGARIVREIVSGELDISPIIDDFKREHQLDEYDPSGGKGSGYHGKGGKGGYDWRGGGSKGGWGNDWGNDSSRYSSGNGDWSGGKGGGWSGGKGGWGKGKGKGKGGGDSYQGGKGSDFYPGGGKGGFGKGGDDSSDYYGGGKGYSSSPAPYGGKGGGRYDSYSASRYGGKGYDSYSRGGVGPSDSYGSGASRYEKASGGGGDYYGKGSYGGGKGSSTPGYAYGKGGSYGGGKGGPTSAGSEPYESSWGKGKGKGGSWSGGWDSSPDDSSPPQGGPSSYSSRPWGSSGFQPSSSGGQWGAKGGKGGYGY
ncbi:hypothetical protein FOZ61_006197 [Perkinsus olseni]|uniref:K Homology domain-containing protein n=1 Tax=Perkinsus olseni TaxID=32597 RepID=A0A7J6MAY8_PEROL|nr:hypothetical protein FOZ61_006197 [Perkinsus olseni]